LALSTASASATSTPRLEVGVLSCGGDTSSIVVASRTDMTCVFRRADGQTFQYVATARRIGLDVGINQRTSMQWGVLAPNYSVDVNDLRGLYGGVSAGASIGYGLGANVLLGGSSDTIALQPLSIEGQSGLGVNAGITGLELR